MTSSTSHKEQASVIQSIIPYNNYDTEIGVEQPKKSCVFLLNIINMKMNHFATVSSHFRSRKQNPQNVETARQFIQLKTS